MDHMRTYHHKEFIAVVVDNNKNQSGPTFITLGEESRVCVLSQGNGSVPECVDQTPITVKLEMVEVTPCITLS